MSSSSTLPPPSSSSSSSNSSAASRQAAERAKTQAKEDDFDVDVFLRTQSNSFNQDNEVDRILALVGKGSNPIEVLDLDPKNWTASALDTREIKNTYRKKSLLLHPDKCKHPKGPDAFEMLKKAETELMDDGKRAWLMALIGEARMIVYKRKGYLKPGQAPVALPSFEKDNKNAMELVGLIKLETRRLMMDQSNRDNIRLKNEVERKAAESTAMAEEKKRKQEHDKQWEETRDVRVGSWRNFLKAGDAKKRRKREAENNPKVLG
ncbi:hypothetical protein HDU76_012158 [Blyttiomyces sp. JEL0837]|nr:hypothetical protein HDU76_012158 [Blyttiomyces sp. JEL0837]